MKPIQEFLRRQGISSAILFKTESPNSNFSYLSGFEGLGVLFIRQRARPLLYVPEPEYHIAKKIAKVDVINAGNKRILAEIKKHFPKSFLSVAIDKSSISLLQYQAFKKFLGFKKASDISEHLSEMRQIKTPHEIKLIYKSCMIAQRILRRLQDRLASFNTEAEAAAFLISETMKEGCKTSFDPIVASAPNSGKWHHTPTTSRIRRGFCIIDFGVMYEGYASDITRTVFIGKPTKKDIDLFSKVCSVQKRCVDMLVPGAKMIGAQEYAQKTLGKPFCHSLGHGIGRNVHEGPNFVKNAVVKKGMVLAIEPGIYYPDKFGIRIEDDVLITDHGPSYITSPPKRFIRI